MQRSLLNLTLCSILLISCSQGMKDFTILTNPSGADIYINGERAKGLSPLTTEVNQSRDLAIVAIKPGYEVETKKISTETNFWKALIWTQKDPLAQYIEQDSVSITLKRIQSLKNYKPSKIPKFAPPKPLDIDSIIKLRKLPIDL